MPARQPAALQAPPARPRPAARRLAAGLLTVAVAAVHGLLLSGRAPAPPAASPTAARTGPVWQLAPAAAGSAAVGSAAPRRAAVAVTTQDRSRALPLTPDRAEGPELEPGQSPAAAPRAIARSPMPASARATAADAAADAIEGTSTGPSDRAAAPRRRPAAPAPPPAPRALAARGAATGPPGSGREPPATERREVPGALVDPSLATSPAASPDASRATSVGAGDPAAAGGEPVVLVYPTRLPPSVRLHYALQRGAVAGELQLAWRRDGAGYELSELLLLPGRAPTGALSRGGIDADGIAPVRLADRRRGRELRAANFRRAERIISFSGPTHQLPLPAGAQDRLSWLLQLPAVVEADSALAQAGARVVLFVVGTRGDAELWRFDVSGHEPLTLPAGPVEHALRLVREPSRPYDQRVEVWLDPARAHLPVQLRLTLVPGERLTEWRLSALLPVDGPAP